MLAGKFSHIHSHLLSVCMFFKIDQNETNLHCRPGAVGWPSGSLMTPVLLIIVLRKL